MNDILMTAHKAWASMITAFTTMVSLPSIDGHASPIATLTSAGINALYGVPGPTALDAANATNAVVTALIGAAATGAATYWVPNQTKLSAAELAALAEPAAPASASQ